MIKDSFRQVTFVVSFFSLAVLSILTCQSLSLQAKLLPKKPAVDPGFYVKNTEDGEYLGHDPSQFEKELVANGLVKLLQEKPDSTFGTLRNFIMCRLNDEKRRQLEDNWVGQRNVPNAWGIVVEYHVKTEKNEHLFEFPDLPFGAYLFIDVPRPNKIERIVISLDEKAALSVRNILLGQ